MIEAVPSPPYQALLRLLDRQLTAAELADLVERLRGDQQARRQAAALLLQVGILGEMATEPDERRPWQPQPRPMERRRPFALAALGAGLALAIALLVIGSRRPSAPGAHRAPVAAVLARTVSHRSALRPIATPAAGLRAVLVRNREPDPSPSDLLLTTHLEGLGFDVVQVRDVELAASDVRAADLVVLSASTLGKVMRERVPATGLREAPVPVVTCESATFDLLGMTAPRSWDGAAARNGFGSAPAHTAVEIAATGHPLAAGLGGSVAVTGAPVALSWGEPSLDAIRVATLSTDHGLATQFAYERGALMAGLRAPARRVGCFISADAAEVMTVEGWALFEAGVRWASGL